jgi:surface antigen
MFRRKTRRIPGRRAVTVAVTAALAATLSTSVAHASTAAPEIKHVQKLELHRVNGLDKAQLAQAAKSATPPGNSAASKLPAESFTARDPRLISQARARTAGIKAAAAPAVYPGMYVPPGTPTVPYDSADYLNGSMPADMYAYMSADDCRTEVPNGGIFTKNRYSSCSVTLWNLVLQECTVEGGVETCEQVGTADWRETVVGQGNNGDLANKNGGTGNGSRMITYEVTIDQITTTGVGSTASLRVDMSCAAHNPAYACTPAQGNGRTATIAVWEVPGQNTADFSFTSPISQGDGGDHVVVAAASTVETCTWGTSEESTPSDAASAAFRFDSAGRNANVDWANKFIGRADGVVFDIVPILSYDGACGSVNCQAITESASHIALAFSDPADTMPPWHGAGPKPAIPGAGRNPYDWLSRTVDSGRANANDAVTTAVCDAYIPVVPPSSNCDEYPFKTTYQGGASLGPYSVLRINGADNQEAGNRLKGFYNTERLLDCDPTSGADGCDAFGVASSGPASTPVYQYRVIDVAPGGTFADEWDATGGAAGLLGTPADGEFTVNGGQQQDFSGGSVYWSSNSGTHEAHGAILADYNKLGGPATAAIGFPLTDQQATPDGGAQENLFAGSNCGPETGGAIIVSGSTPASEMQGCIYQAYLSAYNGPGGPLGYPTSNETPIGAGKVNYMSGTACGTATGSGIYWNGAAHAVTGCVFQKYKAMGEAAGSLGFPTGEAFAISGGTEQVFQHGYITSAGGVTTAQPWLVGHAAHAGNDYPYETIGQFEHQSEGTDDWAEYYGQCDSFAAWKVYENLAGTPSLPPIVPDPNWIPSASPGISPVNQNTWGNADNWGNMAPKFGYTVDQVPAPGAIVWWRNASTDPQNPSLTPDPAHGMGGFGHVGYVTDVYPDGSITVEQYNLRLNGEYSTLHMAYGQSAVDTSFNQGSFTVPWPAGFVHIADGPSGQASPAEPGNGTVSWGYPSRGSQLQVIGPGSAGFSTGNVWYSRPAHGETGTEMYTHANGPTAVSTATWTPSGLAASACYQVAAFVPDNYSDNPVTVYTVTDSTGTSYAAVNENDLTNDWSELGVFKTNSSGAGLSVKVDDRGGTGLYVAADAMRFWRQADCSAQGNASPIMMPGSYYPSGSWSARSGHGFFGTEQYTATTGTLYPTKTATWSPAHLLGYACYDVSLYVPDNFSDNPAATYNTGDAYYGGNFWPTVDENIFTNQFAGIGTLESGSGGYLPVSLQNSGPSGDYVAADAAAFVLNPNCVPQNNGTSAFGQPMSGGIIGPGSPAVNFATTGNWHSYLGFGWANHQLYSPDNAGATATWTFNGTAGHCYNVDAYIPIMGYADNTSAGYVVSNNLGGGLATVNQNITSGWTGLSRLNAGSDGKITVKLTDNGNSGAYTGADAIRFTSC